MRKFTIAAVAVLAIAGSPAVYAQHRNWSHGHMRLSAEDRLAFADAKIAAVHAGLKLTADQEKLWPPIEAAVISCSVSSGGISDNERTSVVLPTPNPPAISTFSGMSEPWSACT